ncbi:MAG: pilus assembly protein [Chloroflexi bacterium]|nr:pilus assembly protein [Chloroflexota bacterium]
MLACKRHSQVGERGQSAVEFAIVLPLLLLILMGTVDFGRLYFRYVIVANAARVGAEYGMDARRSTSDVVSVIKAESNPYVTIGDSDITITANPSWATGGQLKVEVRTQFSAITPVISSMWGGGPLTLRSSTVTRFN